MKQSAKVFGAALCLALTLNAAQAQADSSVTSAADAAGLLGRDYASFTFGVEQIRDDIAKPTGIMPGIDVNLPIVDGFDYRLAYDYTHAANTKLKISDHTVSNGVTGYYKLARFTPFATAGFGYTWDRTTVLGVGDSNNHFYYDLAAGVEVPVTGLTSLRLAVDRDESVQEPHVRNWSYDVSANHWFSDLLGASIGATFKDGFNGAHDAIVYVAGVHLSFD